MSKNYLWCSALFEFFLIVNEPLREHYLVYTLCAKNHLWSTLWSIPFGTTFHAKEPFTVDSLIYTFWVNILYQRISFMDRSLVYALKNWVYILHLRIIYGKLFHPFSFGSTVISQEPLMMHCLIYILWNTFFQRTIYLYGTLLVYTLWVHSFTSIFFEFTLIY